MTNDLTKGSPFKQILFFSIPFLIGKLFQQFYNVADMVIVGRVLDATAYTAIGSTASLIWFAGGAVQSLTVGFSMITAQYFGAKDENGIKRSFAAGLKLSLLFSTALALICAIFARQILELLQTPDDIIDRAYAYIVWIFLGLIATALFNLLSNVIRALGDSRTPLLFLVLACLVNIVLDFVFIALCGMDTDGAGLATVTAQLLSAFLCVLYIKKKHPLLHLSLADFKPDRALDVRLLKIGIPLAFLEMVLSVGGIVMQFVTNGLGTFYVTSQTTGDKLQAFTVQPLLAFGAACAVFASQNYGANRYDRVITGCKKAILIGYLWSGIVALLVLPFGKFFITLIAGNVDDVIVQNAYLYVLIGMPLLLTLAPLIMFKSVLQAVGQTFWSMVSGFTEILARAGVSVLVITLLNNALIDLQASFLIMSLATPMAWLFGFLTVFGDYIRLTRKLKRMQTEILEKKNES